MAAMELIKPPALMPDGTIGIFIPSSPGHLWGDERYELIALIILGQGCFLL